MGVSVCKIVKNVSQGGGILNELNKTLFVLIPKVDNSNCLKIYWPIRLRTLAYKTMTKVITNRIEAILLILLAIYKQIFCWGDISQIILLLLRKSFIHHVSEDRKNRFTGINGVFGIELLYLLSYNYCGKKTIKMKQMLVIYSKCKF